MTFNFNIDKLFTNLRKLLPIFLATGSVAGLILFLPSSAVQKLHLEDIPENWLAPIGIIFLLCVFLIRDCFATSKRVWGKHFTARNDIRELLLSREKYIVLEITDGNAGFFTAKGFIYRPNQPAILGWNDGDILCAKYLAQPWLLTAYNKDPAFFLKA